MLELLNKDTVANPVADKERARIVQSFARSDELLLSPDAMRAYSESWVAAFEGRVVATAPHPDSLFEQLKQRAIPFAEAAVRYIESDGMAAA